MEEDLITYTFPNFFGEGKDLIWDSEGSMFDADLNKITPSLEILSKVMFGTFEEVANANMFINQLKMLMDKEDTDPENNVGPI
tara:strand:- start:808 stop:1056 length:249 start_codon:yes stop_codon:yes gene_type:complete